MSTGVALQAVLAGLSDGAVIGLVALGFTLVWRLTRVLPFAHGDVVVGSVLLAALAVLGRSPVARTPGPWTSVALVAGTLLLGVLLSVLAYLLTVRPFLADPRTGRPADVLGWVGAGIAAGLLLREALGVVLPGSAYAVPDPLRLSRLTGSGVVDLPGGGTLPVRVFGVLAIAVVAGVAAERVLVRSRLGAALRAVADDPEGAALLGVPVQRVVLLAFAAAGLLAGLAGLLAAPARPVSVDDGVLLGLYGAAAALLGRLGSLPGALAGGLVLGVARSVAVASDALGAAWSDVLPLLVLVAVLAVRPEGFRAPLRAEPE